VSPRRKNEKGAIDHAATEFCDPTKEKSKKWFHLLGIRNEID
jgi:hypothetical protein